MLTAVNRIDNYEMHTVDLRCLWQSMGAATNGGKRVKKIILRKVLGKNSTNLNETDPLRLHKNGLFTMTVAV